MPYKVLVDELTVHRTLAKLPQPDGSVLHQNGMGQTYYRDEVIPDEEVAEDWREAMESGEGKFGESLKRKLEATSGDEESSTAARLGVPFAGYEDMEEDDVLNAMSHLPSAAINRVKDYEEQRDNPRERIVQYNIGFGESPIDRQEGRRSGELQERNPDKAAAELVTREVPPDGPVVPGEGVTGTGDPQLAYGAKKAKEEGEPVGDIRGTARTPARRGRRDRQPKPPEGPQPGSLERANE
jgi:hypothetical protein